MDASGADRRRSAGSHAGRRARAGAGSREGAAADDGPERGRHGRRSGRGQQRHRGHRTRGRGGRGRDLHDVVRADRRARRRHHRPGANAAGVGLRRHRRCRPATSSPTRTSCAARSGSASRCPPCRSGGSILAARGRLLDGRVVGLDLETDLAVVKVEATGLPTLAFGDSDELRAGQLVLALGSPLGFYNSVSLGVVSAVARQLEPESPMVYVQSDAPISSGQQRRAARRSRAAASSASTPWSPRARARPATGLGFAAPSNIVRGVYEQIRKNGHVRRGDIGVRPQTLTPVLAAGPGPVARARRRARRRPAGRPGSAGRAAARRRRRSRSTASRWRTAASSRSACIAAPSATSSRSTSCATASRSRCRVTMTGRRDSLTDLSAGGRSARARRRPARHPRRRPRRDDRARAAAGADRRRRAGRVDARRASSTRGTASCAPAT